MHQQSTLSHPYNILYKDMKRFVHYICSCACFYPEKDVLSNQCEDSPSLETKIHFAQERQTKNHTYNSTTLESTSTDEVQHHKSPIETTKECKNPMHSVIKLPPAPIVPKISSKTDNSPSSSSSDDEDIVRINVSEIEDIHIGTNGRTKDRWHVL